MQMIFVALTRALMASSYAQDATPNPAPVKEESAHIPARLPKVFCLEAPGQQALGW